MKMVFKATLGSLLATSIIMPGAAFAHFVHDNYSHLAGWVEGTYYRPSNNGLSVGDLLFASAPGRVLPGFDTLDGGRRHVFLNPENEFDYALGMTYRRPHTHTRFFFSYDHYDNDIDTQGDINIRNIAVAPGVVNPNQETIAGQSQGIASYDLSSHEFRIGAIHDLHFGDHFCLDLLAFFEYDKVRQTIVENNSAIVINEEGDVINDPVHRETENKVRGFGPGVGFMTRWYAYQPHWHLFAGINTTVLSADNDFSQSLFTEIPGAFYIYEPEESDSLIGKIDIQFGINYHCAFRHELRGLQWDIALGMRYINMFNVFKNGNTAWNPNGQLTANFSHTGVVNDAANLGPAQDWGRYGPFLRFVLGGAHS